ncbi:hypothetical protein [Streptomyces sp. NPDC048473]
MVYQRAWTKPIVLFDLATHRLIEAQTPLPDVTTVERVFAGLRRQSR